MYIKKSALSLSTDAVFSSSTCALVTVCFLSFLPAYSLLLPSVCHDLCLPNQRFRRLSLVAAAAAAKSLQSCPTLVRPHRQQPTRLPCPWDSPGKNTEVSCHFLLQCVKVKSQSEVAQSCPTLCDPMDCSLPGSSVHGVFQARVLEWGAIAFSVSLVIQSYLRGKGLKELEALDSRRELLTMSFVSE